MNSTSIVAVAIAAIAAVALAVTFWPEPDTSPVATTTAHAVDPANTTSVDPVVPDANVVRPSFDVVRISREGTGVIAGRAEQDAFVEVLTGDTIIGRVRANEAGEWVLIFNAPLEPGAQELSLIAHSTGMEPVQSDDIVVLSIPERSEDPTMTAENGVVALLAPRYGSGVSRVLQKPGSYMGDAVLEVSTLP